MENLIKLEVLYLVFSTTYVLMTWAHMMSNNV